MINKTVDILIDFIEKYDIIIQKKLEQNNICDIMNDLEHKKLANIKDYLFELEDKIKDGKRDKSNERGVLCALSNGKDKVLETKKKHQKIIKNN